MAKKKQSHQGKQPQNHINQTLASMNEASEKLKNLKSLNSMLIKETIELRHQVNSLDLSKTLTRWEMEKMEKIQIVVDDLKAEKQNVVGEIKGLEILYRKLENEIESMEISLSMARKEVNDVTRKVESPNTNAELRLKLLSNIVEWVQVYFAELETIKNVFQNKMLEVEDQNRQLKLLHNLVAEARKEARKGKNFFTMLRSATAILAAAVACVAYVAQPFF